MAKAKNNKNGTNGQVEEALRNMLQTQTMLAQNQAIYARDLRDAQRENAERFARIEAILLEHSRILAEHGRILQEHTQILEALPDLIRDRMGFRPPGQQ